MTTRVTVTVSGPHKVRFEAVAADGTVTDHTLNAAGQTVPVSQEIALPHGGFIRVGPEEDVPTEARPDEAQEPKARRTRGAAPTPE
jgi:hypothetical protein